MVIDFHTHAFPNTIASRTLASLAKVSGIRPEGDGTRESVVRECCTAGVDLAVVLNVATKPEQMTTINNTAKSQDTFLSDTTHTVCFGSVHPASVHAAAEVYRIKALGLRGIKIHPDYQHTEIADESYFPVFEAAAKCGLVVVTHAGWDPLSPEHVHATPEMCARVLKTFPRLKLVLAHLGGMRSFEGVREHLAGKFENLYFDTAYSANMVQSDEARELIALQGADRVLFGSDFPWSTTRRELEFVRSLGLSEQDTEKIVFRNAARLLGVSD